MKLPSKEYWLVNSLIKPRFFFLSACARVGHNDSGTVFLANMNCFACLSLVKGMK